MIYLFKRKSGIYYFRKTSILPSGKRLQIRQSLKTTDRKLAQYLALRLYFDLAPDNHEATALSIQAISQSLAIESQTGGASCSLSEAIRLFLAERLRAGSWSDKEYRRINVMMSALGGFLGDPKVSAVGRTQANQYKELLMASDRSVTTINNYLKRAAMLFDWLAARGDVSENPFRGVTIKQRRAVAALRSDWTEDQKTTFLGFALQQLAWRKWILLLLRYTGARPSEICQLYKVDVDCLSRTISIHAGRRDQTLKTPSSARTIPIHDELIKAGFLDFVKNCSKERLFPLLNKVQDSYSHTFVTWFSKARAKDPALPELYGARHTAATEMKNGGVPSQYASAVLGHSNNSITYDRYGKSVHFERLREAIAALGQ